jgi:uncharacterized membrane protein (UPF0127 family)
MMVLPTLVHAACTSDTVDLRGAWGSARFNVEVADDEAERARGLMHRESMPTSAGMLFVYDKPRRVSFWMRNTLIPLDMIFADARGVLQHIHHEAQPLDETPVFGGDDIYAVLEINGGLVRRLGIAVGSDMRHPAFDPAQAAWSCED